MLTCNYMMCDTTRQYIVGWFCMTRTNNINYLKTCKKNKVTQAIKEICDSYFSKKWGIFARVTLVFIKWHIMSFVCRIVQTHSMFMPYAYHVIL